ncbi:eukaryotic translation initiation factor 3 subunit K [Elysia marginata]|uniref:Eukaryotic translation initiation factor 3 subunit K n=1 Tax=Elysia marginata TaxID=1093978 RepID=A0AAV4H5T8_9GAST|nr:eukaryotic translation initiation factor 3 subunit K [Elysia marginata]
MRATVASLLKGIERYNPENLVNLERYVDMQANENTYDLEANLAVLKLYQFNPNLYQAQVTAVILLKALTNLPHSDFILCKCMIEPSRLMEEPVAKVLGLAELLETANFNEFWISLMKDLDPLIEGIVGFEDSIRKCKYLEMGVSIGSIFNLTPISLMKDLDPLIEGIVGFEDSIRKFVCHVVASTYSTIRKDKLRQLLGNVTEAQASQWVSKYGWTEQLDGYVFIANQDEHIRTKNITEKISFDSVAAIMASGR